MFLKWWDCATFDMNIYSFFNISGKYYYEVTCHDQGLCRVGWSTSQAALDLGNLHTAQGTLASLKRSV